MQVFNSYVDAALSLPNERAGNELIGMIVRYLATGEEPEPRTEAQRAVLIAIRPSLDSSKARREAGKCGSDCRWNDGKPDSKPDSKADSKPDSKTQNQAMANGIAKSKSNSNSKNHKEFSNENSSRASARRKASKEERERIIGHLNAKTGKAFRADTKATRELINARFAEGFTAEDFIAVIDAKCDDWLGTTATDGRDMGEYLRPSTLFAPKNFEGYLNAHASPPPATPDYLTGSAEGDAEVRQWLTERGAA